MGTERKMEPEVVLQSSDMQYRIDDLKEENRELNRVITDISKLVSYTRVDSMINYLISKLKSYFIPRYVSFFVQPPREGELRQYNFLNLDPVSAVLSNDTYYILKSYFDELKIASNNGFALPYENIKSELSNPLPAEIEGMGLKYVIPLYGIGGIFSIILISNKENGESYTYGEQSYIHRIFSVLAVTMQNGLHYEVSITEPKTGLYTYDYFKTRVDEVLASCRRYKRTAAMLIVDIDHFKIFNDTYGHLVGDKVLIELAGVLKKTVRENDCVARFGGEEFSVLLSECTPESVFEVSERIRKAVERIELYEGSEKLSITISVGSCLINDIKGLTPTYIFKKADDALYYSKQHGRNRSTVHRIGLLEAAELSVTAEKDE